MGLPVVPLLSAVTPIVLGAFDLYRRRSEAKTGLVNAGGESAATLRSADVLHRRLQALEESDLEQARLLSDLSKQVEALAKVVEKDLTARGQREIRLRRQIVLAHVVAGAALVLAGWAMWS